MDAALVAGVGMTRFAKSPRTLRELAVEAVGEALGAMADRVDQERVAAG